MYAVAYDTGEGFGSIGLIGDIADGEDYITVGDPVLGVKHVALEDCYHVLWTEDAIMLPFTYPVLNDSPRTSWLEAEERAPLAANAEQLLLEGFVTGYPIAYERVRFWREGLAPDWRTIALIIAFAVSTIRNRTTNAHNNYRVFGPLMREAFEAGVEPTQSQLLRLPGVKSLGMRYKRTAAFVQLPEYSNWLAEELEESKDYSRRFRNRMAVEPMPPLLGMAKLTFSLALLGRDGACLDTRILKYWFGEEEGEKVREGLEHKTTQGAFSPFIVRRYNKLEERLRGGKWWDPSWPMPYAKAQWTMWEAVGRPPGPEDHAVLWEVLGL